MKRCLASLFAVLIAAASAHAQPQIGSYNPPVVNPRPIVSPYLNLNRNGFGNTAVDYFGIVRPQIDNQRAIQQLQQQFQFTQGQVGQLNQQQPADEMAPTGRALGGYFNYSHYFPLFNRGAGSTGVTGIRR
jgi:hypothetical protein